MKETRGGWKERPAVPEESGIKGRRDAMPDAPGNIGAASGHASVVLVGPFLLPLG